VEEKGGLFRVRLDFLSWRSAAACPRPRYVPFGFVLFAGMVFQGLLLSRATCTGPAAPVQ